MGSHIELLEDGSKIFWKGDLFDELDYCRCGQIADYLCDYPVGEGKTCDMKMCKKCANHVKGDMHYCDEHNGEYGNFIQLQTKERDGSGI